MSTFHWLLSLASIRKYSVLVLCDTVSRLKLILTYECVSLVLLYMRRLSLSLPQQLVLEKCHCPTPAPTVSQEADVMVMLFLETAGVRCPSFQLSLTTMASMFVCLFIDWYFFNLLLLFAFPFPIYIQVSSLPDRHLDPVSSGPSLRFCLCLLSVFFLGCLQFSWIFPGPFPAVSSGGVFLKHVFLAAVAIKGVAVF